uniref:BHLH domain-containing protein n=1 Tax=Parastrongyloides trichosuri TaxID=131310 RepID=A0A0N4ZUW8_PARTI
MAYSIQKYTNDGYISIDKNEKGFNSEKILKNDKNNDEDFEESLSINEKNLLIGDNRNLVEKLIENENLEKIYAVEKRNARERTRVHTVNQAFLVLKHHIPALKIFTKRVSKLKILRAAILYIDTLSNILDDQKLSKTEFTKKNDSFIPSSIIPSDSTSFNMFSFQTHFNPTLVAAHTFPYFDYDSLNNRNNYQQNSNVDIFNNSTRNSYSLESLYNQHSFMSNAFNNIEI